MRDFTNDQHCFVCGQHNAAGLRLSFREDASGGGVVAEVVFPAHLQGWQGVVHGGLLATVLDEIMVQAATAKGIHCVTAEITVKYREPAATGEPYTIVGKVLEARGKLVMAESSLRDASGKVRAQASGKLFKLDGGDQLR
jgi:uncharacterized protein (TIGR00369 family)